MRTRGRTLLFALAASGVVIVLSRVGLRQRPSDGTAYLEQLQTRSVGPLAGLPGSGAKVVGPALLTDLDLAGVSPIDIGRFPELPHLKSMRLTHAELLRAELLCRYSKLETLVLTSCRLDDTGALDCLTGLRHLELWTVEVDDLDWIPALASLETLTISNVAAGQLPAIPSEQLRDLELQLRSDPTLRSLSDGAQLRFQGCGQALLSVSLQGGGSWTSRRLGVAAWWRGCG